MPALLGSEISIESERVLPRWITHLQLFDFKIMHSPDKRHSHADRLSHQASRPYKPDTYPECDPRGRYGERGSIYGALQLLLFRDSPVRWTPTDEETITPEYSASWIITLKRMESSAARRMVFRICLTGNPPTVVLQLQIQLYLQALTQTDD